MIASLSTSAYFKFVSQGANDWSEQSSNPTSYGRSKAPTLHPEDVEDVGNGGMCGAKYRRHEKLIDFFKSKMNESLL